MDETINKIARLYSDNLANHGGQSRAVGWTTPDSQLLRFDKLTEVVRGDGEPFSVNDYGCGYGAHLEYLESQGMSVSAYYGYDISKEMLDTARSRHKDFSGQLDLRQSIQLDTVADYTFVSGTFNVRFESTDEEWKQFILARLDEIHSHSRRGFSFNLLSTYVDWQEPHLFYGDPLFWFDYCKHHYSREVALLHDYPLYEWTIIVRL